MTEELPTFDIEAIRARFPALDRVEDGVRAAYLDGPGGTQVPRSVIDSMTGVLTAGISNLGGGFGPSRDSVRISADARAAMADLLNCHTSEVVFGQNMTSLTYAMSRALARTWQPGDAIVLTSLDHDANFTPWAQAASELGVDVRIAEFDTETGRLDPAAVTGLIDDDVRLVAVCLCSNALGTMVDVPSIAEAAHSSDAIVYVDAVHAAPHRLLDVDSLGCDFLAVSVYKFFGPHVGVLYGKADLLSEIDAYKVRPAPAEPPGKWETGTQSFEALAGVTAAVDHLASLGTDGATRRGSLEMAFAAIGIHEQALAGRFLEGLAGIGGVHLYGIPEVGEERVATFAIDIDDRSPKEVARHLIARGIYVWAGHYYAVNVMDRLGLLDAGGLVRIGFTHYNTETEVDRVLDALAEL